MTVELRTPRTRIRRKGRPTGPMIALLIVAVGAFAIYRYSATRPAPAVGAQYQPISFEALPGWAASEVAAALAPFALSCAAGNGRLAEEEAWSAPCADVKLILQDGGREAAARAFFRAHFTPVAVSRIEREDRLFGERHVVNDRALITGYFEPVYDGSPTRTAEFSHPVLDLPDGYMSVDLGEFAGSLRGRSIAGVLEEGRLRPIPEREAILAEGLAGAEPLAWMRPVDLLFLQIQGSGRLVFEDGSERRIGYAGKNGKAYTAVGRVLVDRKALTLEETSMQTIRTWLEGNPALADDVMNENASWVFFRELDDLGDPEGGPLGAQGVQLAPRRSLALDRTHLPLGAPVFVAVDGEDADLSDLYIAQDVGGAIRGPLRADLYLGSGPEAGDRAGELRAEARLFALLPHALAADLASAD
ncbi:MAG: MltA domain-containing protein [Pseudomonadota bacterium]